MLFFDVLTQLFVFFSSSNAMLDHTKKNVSLSLKSQSATLSENWIHHVLPLRYHLADVFKALKVFESYHLKKKE